MITEMSKEESWLCDKFHKWFYKLENDYQNDVINDIIDLERKNKDLDAQVKCLLKEREAVKPRQDSICTGIFHCGACGEFVGFIISDPSGPNEQDNYCRNCGKPVKWE